MSHLALVGTAYPMVVSPALLDAALNDPQRAIAMVNTFSHSMMAPPPSSLGPGTWLHGSSRALMRRVLASNRDANVFHIGFTACNTYANGEAAMTAVAAAKIPVLFLLGAADQMTLPRAAKPLIAKAPGAKVVSVQAGHALMSEAPDAVLFALAEFVDAR